MIYELRLYYLGTGRLNDAHDRMRIHLPHLLAKHGIPVIGRWGGIAGPSLPLFVYLMEWESFEAREAGWGSFYVDPEWPKIRSQTNAGSEMVERYDLLFMRPNPAWAATPPQSLAKQPGAMHELVLQNVAIGQVGAVNEFLAKTYFPRLQALGGSLIGACDILSGTNLPRLAFFISWESEAARRTAQAALLDDADMQRAIADQRRMMGQPLLGHAEVYLLDPADYAPPVPFRRG